MAALVTLVAVVAGHSLPKVPPYSKLGSMVPRLPPYILILPELLNASARVVMSTSPTVRNPNSAGSAPVTSDMLPIRPVSKTLLKPVTPSGSMTPLMRYCTLA